MSLEDLSLEARDELAALARQLAENPATRKDFLRLTKKAKPDLPIPELEIEEYTKSEVSETKKEMEALRAQLRERDAMADLEKRRQKIVAKGLAKEADIEEIERVMLDKGITNHEAAAEYWAWMKQSAQPTPSGYNPNAMSKFDLSKYWKNPVAGAREEAGRALAELRKNPRPIGL
jgi:hypothetical protein